MGGIVKFGKYSCFENYLLIDYEQVETLIALEFGTGTRVACLV